MKINKKIISFIAGFIILLMVFTGCGKKAEQQEKIFPVKVIKAQPEKISSTITLAGEVDSKIHAVITSPIEGNVIQLKVREGKNVDRGDVLCYVMPIDQQNMLGQARFEYESAKKIYDGLSGGEKDAYQETYKAAKERYEAAKKLFNAMSIASPVKGTVIIRYVEEGQSVSAKQPLMEVADMEKIIIKSAVSQEYVPYVKVGSPVKVSFGPEGKNTIDGKVSIVAPGINRENRTAAIEVEIPADYRLKPGMTVALSLVVMEKDDALCVPLDALIVKSDGSKYFFIVENGRAKMIKAETGIESNTKAEIKSALYFYPGDLIVVAGQENLKDGVKVKIPEQEKKSESKGEKK